MEKVYCFELARCWGSFNKVWKYRTMKFLQNINIVLLHKDDKWRKLGFGVLDLSR
jgi:hypothetical protein